MTDPITVYLGIGTNMGNREGNLDRCLDLLSQRMKMGKVSSVYDTEPQDNVNQPRFLNMVCQVFTRLAPDGLLALAKGIESKMGRTGKTGEPRPIDIDILLYGEEKVELPELVIPHPKMKERAFVLIPLSEIAPELLFPGSDKTIKEMAQALKEVQGVLKWEGD
jgi:2-amino-4-hydroxy-6-hydroxymethyldihydropteridine diphosphokinase